MTQEVFDVLMTKEFAGNLIFVDGGMCYGEMWVKENANPTILNSAAKVQVTKIQQTIEA
jgi:hypothetical protein